MAVWDEDQLAEDVLKVLGILGRGQTASNEDLAVVKTSYDSKYWRLRRLGLAPFPIDQIDTRFQKPLSEYMAGEVASEFGFTGNRLMEHKRTGRDGWVALKSAASTGTHKRRARIEYF